MSVQVSGMNALRGSDALSATLHAASRRIRALMALRYGARALCLSAPLCLLVVGLSKLRLFETPEPALIAVVVAGSLVVGIVLALLRPLTTLDVARLTERRADLKERLSSAVEFQAQGVDPSAPFYSEQRTDADRHAAEVNVRTLYPARLPRELWGGLAATLALFLLFFLPTLPMFWSAEKKRDMAEVKVMGMEIKKIAEDKTKTADQQKLDETKKAAAEARKLGEAMEKARFNKKQSLVELQKLTRKIEEAQKKLAVSLPAKSLEQAHTEFKKSLDQMQKELEKQRQDAAQKAKQEQQANAGKKPGEKDAPKPQNESNAMKQAKAALQQMEQALAEQDHKSMQQAMEKLAEQMQNKTLTKEEMQQLQKALQQLAQALKGTNQDAAAQQMEQLAQQMSNMSNMDPQTLQKMAALCKKAGQSLGKNPGMSKGMMDMKSLEEMAQALKEGRMTICMGSGKLPGMGNGERKPGSGYNGGGGPATPMKEPEKLNPKLMAMGQNQPVAKGIGKDGSVKEMNDYLAKTTKSSAKLPNGQIKGTRSEHGNEQQINLTGDPEPSKSNTPYYQVYQSSKKQAENALSKENIPAAYKEQVRKYFDSIHP